MYFVYHGECVQPSFRLTNATARPHAYVQVEDVTLKPETKMFTRCTVQHHSAINAFSLPVCIVTEHIDLVLYIKRLGFFRYRCTSDYFRKRDEGHVLMIGQFDSMLLNRAICHSDKIPTTITSHNPMSYKPNVNSMPIAITPSTNSK